MNNKITPEDFCSKCGGKRFVGDYPCSLCRPIDYKSMIAVTNRLCNDCEYTNSYDCEGCYDYYNTDKTSENHTKIKELKKQLNKEHKALADALCGVCAITKFSNVIPYAVSIIKEYAENIRDTEEYPIETSVLIQKLKEQKQRITELEKDHACTIGIGDGSGKMFVHGDYDSIKHLQKILLDRASDKARIAELEKLKVSNGGMFERVAADACLECRDILMANNGRLPTHLWTKQEHAVCAMKDTLLKAHIADRAADRARIAELKSAERDTKEAFDIMRAEHQEEIDHLKADKAELVGALKHSVQFTGNEYARQLIKKHTGITL